jgi:outer membrane protein assembly factor BamB
MYKVGPSLVALDEITGQIRWAYGPMVAGTVEESRLRFESAPAAGPQAVYAGYVLDHIEGDTHTDTEYGLMAFEAATGRLIWQTRIGRLRPGQFSAGFAVSHRNKVRSFSSPPLYHEGTVYYGSNAGAIVAVDALSGRIKWLMRYPYYPSVHDSTRPFGGVLEEGRMNPWRSHEPSFWFGQRPLMVGERLLVLPVDTRFMFCLDRKTGRVSWSYLKGWGGFTHVVGPTRAGQLVFAHCGRGPLVKLMDLRKGEMLWQSPDPILEDNQPVMRHPSFWNDGSLLVGGCPGNDFGHWGFHLAARPFLSSDDHLSVGHFVQTGPYGVFPPYCANDECTHYKERSYRARQLYPPYCFNMAELALAERTVIDRRRYYAPLFLTHAADAIDRSKKALKVFEDWPRPLKEKEKRHIEIVNEVAVDSVPVNRYGPFMPFTRMTFERFGVLFELRFGPQELSMVYDAEKLSASLAARSDVDAEFAKAEIDVNSARYEDAARRLARCLDLISPEDVLYRTQVNQQLYAVRKKLTRLALDSGQVDKELANAEGMSQTVTQLSDEIETLFVLSEANERKGNPRLASRQLQSIVEKYGHYEFPTTSLLAGNP